MLLFYKKKKKVLWRFIIWYDTVIRICPFLLTSYTYIHTRTMYMYVHTGIVHTHTTNVYMRESRDLNSPFTNVKYNLKSITECSLFKKRRFEKKVKTYFQNYMKYSHNTL